MKELPEPLYGAIYAETATELSKDVTTVATKVNEIISFLAEHEVKEEKVSGEEIRGAFKRAVEKGELTPVKEGRQFRRTEKCNHTSGFCANCKMEQVKEEQCEWDVECGKDRWLCPRHGHKEDSSIEDLLEEYADCRKSDSYGISDKDAKRQAQILHTLKEMLKKEYERGIWDERESASKVFPGQRERIVRKAKRSVVEEILKMQDVVYDERMSCRVVKVKDIESYLKEL